MNAVKKLIAQEHDCDEMQKKVCEVLTLKGGFVSTWFLLTNPDRVSGTSSRDDGSCHLQEFIQYIRSGNRPPCIAVSLKIDETLFYSRERCLKEGCPLAFVQSATQSVLIRRLTYKDQIYGSLLAVIPNLLCENTEEMAIFEEITYDLAHALYTISREKSNITVEKDRDHWKATVEAISYIAEKCIADTVFQDTISGIFDRIGNLSNYGSITLFENVLDEDGVLKAVSRWEWTKGTEIPHGIKDNPFEYEYDRFISWEIDLANGDYITGVCGDLDNEYKNLLLSRNVGSFVLFPIFAGDTWWGLLECGDPDQKRSWSHVDLMACTIAGSFIGSAIVRERMNESVKKAEKRYYDLFNQISEAIVLFEVTGEGAFCTISEVNTTCCETFLYLREELFSLTISDLISLVSDEIVHYHARELHTMPNPTFEIDCIRHDSSTFPAEITLNLIKDKDRSQVLAVIRDISERKSADYTLITSEQRYRQLFESAGEAIIVLQDSDIYDCNYYAGLLFGKFPYELFETSFLDYAPEYQPDGRRSMDKLLHIILSVQKGNTEQFEWQIIGNNKVEIITSISMTRLSAEDDSLFLTLIHDISSKVIEQKRMNFLSSITEQVSDFLITIDADTTTISYANNAAEKEFGYSLTEIEGKDIGLLFPQLFEKEESIIGFITAIAEKQKYSCVIQGTHVDGSTFIADIRISPLFDEHNDIRALIFAGRNITGIIKLQERELLSMKQIEENIAQLAILNDHIRNPLTLILGYTELENGPYAQKIIEQIRIIDTIIDKLDRGFLESDKIREYLRKHHEMIHDKRLQ